MELLLHETVEAEAELESLPGAPVFPHPPTDALLPKPRPPLLPPSPSQPTYLQLGSSGMPGRGRPPAARGGDLH
jgi:hypothetical protein